jgi:hypothetical protein
MGELAFILPILRGSQLGMGPSPNFDDFDPMLVQREAALFYGLFLRGHPAEVLRRDIEIPKCMIDKWMRHAGYDFNFRENARKAYEFRRQVLAVFDELIDQGRYEARFQ